ncbi:MAG: T9SS type A sorting domain-containing protein [Bacteroidia bacterium]
MKRNLHYIFLVLILISEFQVGYSQTFYSTGFSAGHGWTINSYNNLNVTVEGDLPNIFYISDKESGKSVGDRGGANCGNPTLHISSTTIGDAGAAYDAGGCTNLGFGPCAMCASNGLYCVTADKSAVSPVINTTGFTGITLQFSYIHFATALLDNAQIIYSVDGGVTWTVLANLPKSSCCSGGASCLTGCTANACSGTHQGKWTLYSSVLPAACENITNLRVGLRWYNDDVSTGGKDPSVAIDDLILYVATLPIEHSFLQSSPSLEGINLSWQTFSEKNNLGFDIERSTDNINYVKVLDVKAKGPNLYSVFDENANLNTVYYYRFKQKDLNGQFKYSNITSAEIRSDELVKIYPNPASNQINFVVSHNNGNSYNMELLNALGRKIYSTEVRGDQLKNETFTINTNLFANGIYFYNCIIGSKTISGKFIIQK